MTPKTANKIANKKKMTIIRENMTVTELIAWSEKLMVAGAVLIQFSMALRIGMAMIAKNKKITAAYEFQIIHLIAKITLNNCMTPICHRRFPIIFYH